MLAFRHFAGRQAWAVIGASRPQALCTEYARPKASRLFYAREHARYYARGYPIMRRIMHGALPDLMDYARAEASTIFYAEEYARRRF